MGEIGDTSVPEARRHGRGATLNASGRYEPAQRVGFDDGWGAEEDLPPLRTTVARDTSRSVIARNTSPDVPFDRSINPYRGCEHGCIYCFARPSHAWLGLSPGLDFETKLTAKPEAAALLAAELARPGYACAPIAFGTNTDPYQPIERSLGITRSLIEVLAAHDHPLSITTKSALVRRDIDLLAPMAAKNLVQIGISVTTLDRDLARRMEPRASSPERRLQAITALSEAGIPVAVLVAPVIPGLNDHEIEAILARAAEAGAVAASSIVLRLPREVAELFPAWLAEHYPDRAARVMKLVRSLRGGRDNDPRFGTRMSGEGPLAQLLARRLDLAIARHGLDRRRWDLDTTLFRPPAPPAKNGQMSLF
ncbi:MAG: PA0069 family radical SAM protein [Alphaproteobacteria bacterium]|nr:PA0069 family radical SAM protein [Alphaproteobacteria bacterium]